MNEPESSEVRVDEVEPGGEEASESPPVPRPDPDCCQSGCYGCAWADAMRECGEL